MPPESPGTTLFIFDADDTLRRTLVAGQPCPRAPGEWALCPGVRERLARVPWGAGDGGAHFAIASNQDQVGYGLLAHADAHRLLVDLAVAAAGFEPPAPCIQLCPHRPHEGCDCRKPAPAMLQRIMQACAVPASRTLFVGDATTDAEAARRAGVAFAWAWDFFGATEAGLPEPPREVSR